MGFNKRKFGYYNVQDILCQNQIRFNSFLKQLTLQGFQQSALNQTFYAQKYFLSNEEKKSSIQFDVENLKSLHVIDKQDKCQIKSQIVDSKEQIQISESPEHSDQRLDSLINHKFQTDRATTSLIDVSDEQQDAYEQKKLKNKTKNIKKTFQSTKNGGRRRFSLDMTDFFKFKKQNKILPSEDGIFKSLNGGHLVWILLLYTVCNSAIIPAWIMSIKANKILRISWRFLLQSFVMIPFVLYEKRSGNQQVKKKYRPSYIFALEGIRKVYVSSLGTSLWFTIILSCFEWTYISHSLVLGSFSNFFLSLSRSFNHQTHQLEPGGQIFVVFGIIFVLADVYRLNVQEYPHSVWDVINQFYLMRQPFQRVIADLAALTGALLISRFSQMTADLKSYYPPFLSMFIVNILVSFHVGLSAYFFNGATLDLNTNFGVWAIFTSSHFTGFLYMAVILTVGMLISFTMISKLFTDPIIPALAMTLEPFIATFFLNLVSVQSMPGSFSIFGYIFLICGLFLILIGQYMLQKKKQRQLKRVHFQAQLKLTLIKDEQIFQLDNEIKQTENYKLKKQLYSQQILRRHGQSDIIHY